MFSIVLVLVFAGLAACNTDNEVPDDSSALSVGTPAPTATVDPGMTPTPVPTVEQPGPGTPTSTPTVDPGSTAGPGVGQPVTVTPSPTVIGQPTPPRTPPPPPPTPVAPPSPTSTKTPSAGPTVEPEPLRALQLERVFSWSSPTRPTHLAEAPDESGRIFVSEQSGRILELTGDPTSATGSERLVLDIRLLVTGRANEEGLLGFALHPKFGENGKIFVYYSATGPRRSIISEFTFQPDGLIDPGSERKVLEVLQPQSNHNGGMLAFGPDGFLYISLGDGGGAGDQANNAQNTSVVLGSILRINIDTPGRAYSVPGDNPFATGQATGLGGGLPEIWAYGLRNPWRFSFDMETGELWAGDVGQNRVEEIDLIVRGGNYGWRLKEGTDCFHPSSGCDQDDFVEPVVSYSHSFGCSVSGGYVYRGSRLPSLHGAYVYGDFCSGIIWGLRHVNGSVQEQMVIAETSSSIPAFGQTLDGEVYVLTYSPGIFRFVEE